MDNKQNNNLPENSNWLDEILGTTDTAKELGPDELAIHAAGLTHPNDLELEKILSEDWDSVPDLETEELAAPEAEPAAEVIAPEDEIPAAEAAPSVEAAEPAAADEAIPEISIDDIIAEYSSAPQPVIEEPVNEPMGDIPVIVSSAAPEPIAEEPVPEETTSEETVTEPAEQTQHFPFIDNTQVVPSQENHKKSEQINTEKKPESNQKEAAVDNKEKIKVRKIRPKPKQGYGFFGIPHILVTVIWIFIAIVIGLTLGHTLWLSVTDLMAFGKPDQQVTVTITEEDVRIIDDETVEVDIDTISQKLQEAGLIEYPTVFKIFATKITSKAMGIEPGTYVLNTKYDYNALINNMQSHYASRAEVELLIPEGYSCAQIFKLLEENNICSVEKMEAYMVETGRDGLDGEYALSEYWFLEDAPSADKYWLEGYLFPDTYRFFENDEPENIVKKFLDGFDYRFTDVMHEKLENIEQNTGLDLSIRDVVIIASMIEKESANVDENYQISSVIFNRLNNSSSFPYLNIDATIVYALDGNIDPTTGLSKPLTKNDLEINHPYNTYKNRGLPPGPIANPGRNALDAALSPEDTNFFYYVLNPVEEKHIFASTLSEHEQNINYVNSLD